MIKLTNVLKKRTSLMTVLQLVTRIKFPNYHSNGDERVEVKIRQNTVFGPASAGVHAYGFVG